MKNDSFFLHLAVAAAISFGVSIYAFAVLGVFAPVPFVAVSTGVALAAALGGFLLGGRRLALTAAIALILRIAILAAAVGV
jgi:hypothetical protein